MYYSDELVEEVRSKNDIVDVISGYVKLQKKGNSYFGLCPFHNEKTASFSVSRQKQMYYCFGCGAGGNVFTFLMEYEHCSFTEAMQMLAERAGVTLPTEDVSGQAKRKADERALLLEINKAAAQYFYVQLTGAKGKTALAYLTERGVTKETIQAFGLGYANKYSDDLYRFLKGKGYADEALMQSGLITMDEKHGPHDKFWNRVMFPIMDANSRVIGFGGRVMGEGKPKYLNSPETPIFDKSRNLYGLHRARKSRTSYFLLCEGYMDVIALQQAGFTQAVASLGTALTQGHASILKRYVSEVYLTYDNDAAGDKAALRAYPILKEAGLRVKAVRLSPDKDPDEFIKHQGKAAFEQRIKEAQDGFLYSLSLIEKEYDMTAPDGKTSFLREAARRLGEFDEEIERNNYIEAVADAYHVRTEDLRQLVVNYAVEAQMAAPVQKAKPTKGQEKEDGILKSQKILLTYMASDAEAYRQVSRYIKPEDFTGELYQQVARLLASQYESGQVNPARILDAFTEEEEHREVASLFHASIAELSTEQEQEKALLETVIRIKSHSLDEAARKLDPADMEGLSRLMQEKREIQNLSGLT